MQRILSLFAFALFLTFSACDSGGGGATCGDEVREGAELCDGADLGEQTCVTMGYLSGTLGCTAACQFDFTACSRVAEGCGDGVRDADEECDGPDLQGESCETRGYGTGTLTCDDACRFDESDCSGEPCVGEHCDDECQEDADCPVEGESCVDGVCGVACLSSTDCLWDGRECADGICAEIECRRSEDCPVGALCKNRACQMVACAEDGSCDSGLVCQEAPAWRCVECSETADCTKAGSYECVDDHCILQCADALGVPEYGNDTPSEALPLVQGTLATATLVNFGICGWAEEDWYVAEVEASRHYTLTLHFDAPPLGTVDNYEGLSAKIYAGRDFSSPIAEVAMSTAVYPDLPLNFTTDADSGEIYLLVTLDERKYQAAFDIDVVME